MVCLKNIGLYKYIVTDLINALPGNSSLNTVKHTTTEEAVPAVTSHNGGERQRDVFSVDPTDATIDWLESDHVMCLL
jgi:hypothetical protein